MSYNLESLFEENLTKKSKCKVIPIKNSKIEYFAKHGMSEYVFHRIKSMEDSFLKVLMLDKFMPINHICINQFYTFGMITSITGNKLEDEIFLWNPKDDSNILMKLNIEGLKMFSLYNGAIVALKARNIKGNELLVENIYYLPIINTNTKIRGNLKMIVARGEFTENTINELLDLKTDVIVMFGPFSNFKIGPFSDFDQFLKMIKNKLEKNKFQNQKIILVPSLEDKNFVNVFPQVSDDLDDNNILLLNNPSYFYVNNHLISVSNFDALFDLSKNEYFKEAAEGEIDHLFSVSRSYRLAYLNVWQKSFSPVIPSSFNVAYGNWLDMELTPDILITFSKLKYFVADINPVTYLNIGISNNYYHIINSKNSNNKEYNIELNQKYKNTIKSII